MVEVENLSKSFGRIKVLENASLRAKAGETTILTGDNGTGKTTLLRILAGLARATSGSAKIAGVDVSRNRQRAQENLSFLPQKLAFHPTMTPERLLLFYARLRKKRVTSSELDDLLRQFHLYEHRTKQVRHLSGGMLQRLGIALLLLPDAPVLLLDEPAISLDPGWRRKLSEILRNEAKRGKTVLLTTHLPQEWEGEANRHLVCRDRQIFEVEIEPAFST